MRDSGSRMYARKGGLHTCTRLALGKESRMQAQEEGLHECTRLRRRAACMHVHGKEGHMYALEKIWIVHGTAKNARKKDVVLGKNTNVHVEPRVLGKTTHVQERYVTLQN